MSAIEHAAPERPWPFPLSELTAGLRRHFGQPRLRVQRIWECPLDSKPGTGTLRGLSVEVDEGPESNPRLCEFVVKEPVGTTRAGLAGAGLREIGVYRALAALLPLGTPMLIAADPSGAWLILERVPSERSPEAWTPDDYRNAVTDLALLHDRFWGLEEDLSIYPWLGRPLNGDFEIHIRAAASAVERMVYQDAPSVITESVERLNALARLLGESERVAAPLRAAPQTLLHGDYWPGNIVVRPGGRRMVLDWQMAGIGPGVLDLAVFVQNSRWWYGELPGPPEGLIALYRAKLAAQSGRAWTDEEWALLWEHALMWRFLQEWLDLLAAMPRPLVEARAELLEAVWLRPVMEAIERRL